MSHIKTTVMTVSFLPTKKILVVDDNPITLKVLSSALESKGYEVFTAVDGPEAFTIVRREKPDLILLDIFFPPDAFQSGNTWDAFLIMNWLQRMCGAQARNIPVFVISGAKPEEFRGRCLAAGAAEYFQKPINIHELLNAIQQISCSRVRVRPRESDVPLELSAISDSDRLRL
jgi:two-component system sensor histidine kinase/response regulator